MSKAPVSIQADLGLNTHPGLELDKYPRSLNDNGSPITDGRSEKVQKPTIENVVKINNKLAIDPGRDLLPIWRKRFLDSLPQGTSKKKATLKTPMALHLARASALENAGTCLHAVYGFTYLPGTGLKGMARAYSETVWLKEQPNKVSAWLQIEKVFGWAPGDRLSPGKSYRPDNLPEQAQGRESSTGAVVFHDGWPESWPKLAMDIVTPHHGDYYGAKTSPPDDTGSPIPSYFIAVRPEAVFHFSISARHTENQELTDLAMSWLLGALAANGAGGKTASGYGRFQLDGNNAGPVSYTLELTSPGFLGGAEHGAESTRTTDLRGATLRGHLRWWWRTMHAYHLNPCQLKELESVVWGDTARSSAVKIALIPMNRPQFIPVKYTHDLMMSGLGIVPSGKKFVPGIKYFAYGMNESGNSDRYYIKPGAQWNLHWKVQDGFKVLPTSNMLVRLDKTADQINKQAMLALRLLCALGAVGSKSRHGFGSLQLNGTGITGPENLDNLIDEARREAKEFRDFLYYPSRTDMPSRNAYATSYPLGNVHNGPFVPASAWVSSLELLHSSQIVVTETNHGPAHLIHYAGEAYETVMQTHEWRHNLHAKRFFGLPRRTMINGRSTDLGFNGPGSPNDRHASPVHMHVGKAANGQSTLALTCFLTPWLDGEERIPRSPTIRRSSLNMLDAFVENFMENLSNSLNDAPPIEDLPPPLQTNRDFRAPPVIVKVSGPKKDNWWPVEEEGNNRLRKNITTAKPPSLQLLKQLVVGKLYRVEIGSETNTETKFTLLGSV